MGWGVVSKKCQHGIMKLLLVWTTGMVDGRKTCISVLMTPWLWRLQNGLDRRLQIGVIVNRLIRVIFNWLIELNLRLIRKSFQFCWYWCFLSPGFLSMKYCAFERSSLSSWKKLLAEPVGEVPFYTWCGCHLKVAQLDCVHYFCVFIFLSFTGKGTYFSMRHMLLKDYF